jgi:hypothetical protein
LRKAIHRVARNRIRVSLTPGFGPMQSANSISGLLPDSLARLPGLRAKLTDKQNACPSRQAGSLFANA